MEEASGNSNGQFSMAAMALNALERSRADQRFLESYKCPCTQCKGEGRPILRMTIETHLRRHGRDPTLTHSMLVFSSTQTLCQLLGAYRLAGSRNACNFFLNEQFLHLLPYIQQGGSRPEDSDDILLNFGESNEDTVNVEGEENVAMEEELDQGMDFHRLTTEWFQRVDDRRDGFGQEQNNENGDAEHDEAVGANPDMEDWLRRSQVPLYQGSKISILASVLVLMNLAHLHNVSNSFMDELMSFLALDVLPIGNGLPRTQNEGRRFIDRLGLSFNTIHACRNGCVLFWKGKQHLSQCPKCHSSRYVEGSSTIPVKGLRHFPVIPRLLRMYRCRDIASLFRWHEKNPSSDGKMRSALDSPAWREVKNIDASFFENSRNVKLGLSLDGMNPFADMSTRHSTWPVFLLNYNLPGWMVTKRFFVMLSLIIPGKESVKFENIDVYLEPLVDELLILWDGVPAIDMSESPRAKKFTLRGMLLWTIHDYPGYGLISGCATKGYQGCPICGPNADSRYSRSLKKNIFQGHRRYLPRQHPFRFMTQSFNGKQEHRQKPTRVSGEEHRRRGEARERWLAAGGVPGSDSDPLRRHGVKRNSILFRLPYWDKLLIRHILDVMHCERNFAENLLKTVFGMKDGSAVREDMKECGCKPALHIRREKPPRTGFRVPKAPYIMSEENKRRFLERLSNLKAPTGFMSNMKSRIFPDGTLHGLKSHDYHVLMQQVFPVCISGLLPDRVIKAIMQISSIFNKLCSKTVDPVAMASLNEEVAIALCLMEREFPPSFFDPMTHLLVHLVEELELCGPVQNRWMYPLERYMKYMKSYVRNKARPEGCMAMGTALEVGLGLCTEYILECESTRQRVWDVEEEPGESGEVTCCAYLTRTLSSEERLWAHSSVLNNSSCLVELRETHKRLSFEMEEKRTLYRQGVHPRQRRRLNFPLELQSLPNFSKWLQEVVQSGEAVFEDDVVDLSMLPSLKARSFKSMRAYGKHFRVSSAEVTLLTADSGVTVTCETMQQSGPSDRNQISGLVTYFGKVIEILELDYGRLKPIVLLCNWVEPIWRGPTACLKKDKYGFTAVKLNRLMRNSSNSFVFPAQVSQIFFSRCLDEEDWSIVLHADSRSTRVVQDVQEDCISAVLDATRENFMDELLEDDNVDMDGVFGMTEAWGEDVTENDLLSTHGRGDSGTQQVEEELSDDDTLLHFGTQEKDVDNT